MTTGALRRALSAAAAILVAGCALFEDLERAEEWWQEEASADCDSYCEAWISAWETSMSCSMWNYDDSKEQCVSECEGFFDGLSGSDKTDAAECMDCVDDEMSYYSDLTDFMNAHSGSCYDPCSDGWAFYIPDFYWYFDAECY